MCDDAGLVSFGIVGWQWVVEERQHACSEGEADEERCWQGKWESMHGKEQGSLGTIPFEPDPVKQYDASWA